MLASNMSVFQVLDFQNTPQSEIIVNMDLDQEREIVVTFDPSYKDDLFSRMVENAVVITYKEHPHTDQVKLKGEVTSSLLIPQYCNKNR